MIWQHGTSYIFEIPGFDFAAIAQHENISHYTWAILRNGKAFLNGSARTMNGAKRDGRRALIEMYEGEGL